ncbi:MAG: hypothetical protein D6743_02325, partial [Calditrichaeota bacterium]
YQTFDFDDPETSNRNIVNRQFILANNSHFAVGPRSLLQLGVNYELAEQGRFVYNRWRQSLALSWRNQEFQLRLRHKVGEKLEVAPGGSYFRQVRWSHKVTPEGKLVRTVKDRHTNFGPIFEITYRPGPSLEFLFFGNIQYVNSSRRETEHINNFDVQLNWFF